MRLGLASTLIAKSARPVQDQVEQARDQGLFQRLAGEQYPRQQGACDGLDHQVGVGVGGQFSPVDTPADQGFGALEAGAPVGAPAVFQVVLPAHGAEVEQRGAGRCREVSGQSREQRGEVHTHVTRVGHRRAAPRRRRQGRPTPAHERRRADPADPAPLTSRRLCRDVGAVVVAVHYRRAPEHPFPAPYEDCLAAARHAADHIEQYGARRDRLAVAGDSAGVNLAAAIAQTFRDENLPLAAQLLAYPATDFDGNYPSRTENATGYLLTTEDIADLQHLYAGDDPALRRTARVSPLRARSLAGLAPAIVATAQYDPLRDEGLAYAQALRDADVEVFVRNYDGLIHGFLNMSPLSPASDAAVAELYTQLTRRLDTTA